MGVRKQQFRKHHIQCLRRKCTKNYATKKGVTFEITINKEAWQKKTYYADHK